jgi:hypothetical protein
MQVLTLESLDNLRKFVREDADFMKLISASLEELEGEVNLQFVDLQLPALEGEWPNLSVAVDEESSAALAATDVSNAPAFYNALSGLAPAHATDERIWATLALDRYSDYTKQRWQLVPKTDEKARNWILAHWLCGASNRSKFRDNSISRLWWMGKVACSIPGWTPAEVAETMITNTDYRQQLLDRTTSFTATGVAKAVLEISREFVKANKELSREEFRSVMMEINFQAGKSNLAVLSDLQLIDLFRPMFEAQWDQ